MSQVWDEAGSRFTSGQHANGVWKSPMGTATRKPFIRKSVDKPRTQGSSKGACGTCFMALNMLEQCDEGHVNNF